MSLAQSGCRFVVLATASLFSLAAWAQEVIPKLKVDVWPEYDKPAALVMLHAELSSAPGADGAWHARLPVPVVAGEPHAVAFRVSDGRLMLAQYDLAPEGDWQWVQVTAGSPQVQLEYYLPLDLGASERTIPVTWPGGPAVGALDFEVLEPAGASAFVLTPAATSQNVGQLGETYHGGTLGAVAAGQKAELVIRYAKSDSSLTKDVLARMQAMQAPTPLTPPAMPAASMPGAPATPPAAAAAPTPVWVYVIGVLVVIVAGVMLFRPVKKR